MPLEQRHTDLRAIGDRLFTERLPLMSMWQETGDHFWPEQAFFTAMPNLGRDFTSHLTSSYPIMVRRDLGDAISAMLRPKGKQWFGIRSAFTDDDDASRRWLEYASEVQRRAMYDRASQFVRATKAGDHFFACFGQCILSLEMNRARDGLLYRCWHLKDVVWSENAEGEISCVHRNWEPTLQQLKGTFGDKGLAPAMAAELSKTPFRTVKVRHVVIRSDEYAQAPGQKKWNAPYVSIFMDIDNSYLIEERPIASRYYIIPRWQLGPCSQYAYSPAVIAALPDARLIQAMTLTLLQAGERASDPPMVAVQGALRSDVDLRSGGVTWVASEYDERLGEALRPVKFETRGLQYGLQMQQDIRAQIREAFYLDKLGLPPAERESSATEITVRVQEYIRRALPLFEPLEDDYNGQVCDETFSMLMRNGAFGPKEDIPPALMGANVQFHFESPLLRAEGSEKGAILENAARLGTMIAQLDPGVGDVMDWPTAFRDAMYGTNVPTKWTNSPEDVAARQKQRQTEETIAKTLQGMQGGGEAIKAVGEGASAVGMGQEAAAAG